MELSRTTRLLSNEDIRACMQAADYLDAVERGFVAHATGAIALPGVQHIAANGGAFHVKSAGLRGNSNYVAVKVNGNFPGNFERLGLPTIQGLIVLCDADDGRPLAVMDSIEITARRTAAASALAVRQLARTDARQVGIIGCGLQGRMHIDALRGVMDIERIRLFDINPSFAHALAESVEVETGIPVTAFDTLESTTLEADVVVTCTTARQPILALEHISPGTFVAAVGADNADKQELEPDLLANSKVVVDVLAQCAEIGELHHAIDAQAMTVEQVHASLGNIVSGEKPGRVSNQEIIVFDSTGSAFQDVTAAGKAYELAVDNNLGHPIRFS